MIRRRPRLVRESRGRRFLSLAKQGMFAHGTTPSASKGAAAT
jgi:hypothetical protein